MNLFLPLAIKQGAVFAYPTETVWGLGCSPFHYDAVMRILDIKHRDLNKGLILLVGQWDQLGELFAQLPAKDRMLLNQPTLDPTTYLIEHKNLIPSWITGQFKTVAVRRSTNAWIKQICAQLGHPIVSTSANVSGQKTVRNKYVATKQFYSQVDFIAPGDVDSKTKPSKIIHLSTQKRLR
ncbi:MAG: L-threonylcarbamoyladenylate synthase [Saccharospirillaceae bacterium]|nr:L-threonylcarbamoyladenylate synthase [Pseudomonadales bacterium]NRB78959.1 L-threonylcarbamoyladenylate synthase [Saccharospirillaceae bacterium]